MKFKEKRKEKKGKEEGNGKTRQDMTGHDKTRQDTTR